MASYRLIKYILSESAARKNYEPLNLSDLAFSCPLFRDPSRTQAELAELERCGYISRPEPDHIVPTYRSYNWRRILLMQILRYVGLSIVTPILVTLLTMWISGALQPPA